MISIYTVTGPDQKRYVGQTSQPVANRWHYHVRQALRGKTGCSHLWAAIRKHGVAAFEVKILWEVETREESNQAEKTAIRMLRTQDPAFGYNMTPGGDGQIRGWHPPLTSRGFHGAPHRNTPEQNERLSRRYRGRRLAPETCAKLSIAHMGHHPSAETLAKMSASQKGRTITWRKKISEAMFLKTVAYA